MSVVPAFPYAHNRLAAAWQDYHLAVIEREAAAATFDPEDPRSVARMERATRRWCDASDRYKLAKRTGPRD